MIRHLPPVLLALALTASAAEAWQAGVDGTRCTLSHTEAAVSVHLTYDPAVPLYTITMTLPEPWPPSAEFGMRFDGPRPNTIRTTRHVVSPDRRSLSVSDRGFGNVLDGLQFNATATGFSGAAIVTLSLEGAAEPVARFRSCTETPSV
ncbi:hypothetical protein V8J82_11050 [Gymnodinialimonas sp. 2305UL16-5]|uniref:hypothetical protein n=1 Tax=Gymnodinialimonas mytili TaxID=3126503 RepID=UPI0030A83BAE